MISVELKEDEITGVLLRLSRAMTDMSPVMDSIGEQLEYETEQRFEQGVAPDGTPWAPKSQATIDAYTRRGGTVDFRPLYGQNLDGTPLRKSFHRDFGPDFVEIGTNKIQAAVMQFGAAKGAFGTYKGKGFGGTSPEISIPWGNIPARPFIGISETDRSNITTTVEEWLESAANAGNSAKD